MGILDLIGHKYPFTDFHELNLDWCISAILQLQKYMEEFTAGNKLIFAEPMQHDLTKTYAKNTIVLDDNGNAYISLQPVPKGVQLSNADYWLMVFNFEDYTEKANKNFTDNYFINTTRAPYALEIDDWIVLDDVLYEVTADIAADDLFEIGVNIVHFTVEQFLKDFIASAIQIINQYKNDIDASELAYRQQLAQDIANTTASLQAQLDAAIAGVTVDSEVINARIGWNDTTYDSLGNELRYLIGAVSEQTRNLITMTIPNANISAAGVIIGSDPNEKLHIAKVTSGVTYYLSGWDGGQTVFAFFSGSPLIGSTSYDGTRTVQSSRVVTAPINGYIAFRTLMTEPIPQIEVGSAPTSYIQPISAKDIIARSNVATLNNKLNGMIKAIFDRQLIPFIKQWNQGVISGSGVITTNNNYYIYTDEFTFTQNTVLKINNPSSRKIAIAEWNSGVFVSRSTYDANNILLSLTANRTYRLCFTIDDTITPVDPISNCNDISLEFTVSTNYIITDLKEGNTLLSNVIRNAVVSGSDGTISASTNYFITPFIKIPDDKKLYTNNYRNYVLYDSSFAFLGSNVTDSTTPTITTITTAGAAYIRFSAKNENLSTFIVSNLGFTAAKFGIDHDKPIKARNLKDMVVYGFGDSLMYGHLNNEGMLDDLVKDEEMIYYNYSANGAEIHDLIKNQVTNAPDIRPDFVVFDGLTNDAYDSFVTDHLGSLSNSYTGGYDLTTFYGSFEHILYTMRSKWLDTNIIYVCVHNMPTRTAYAQETLQAAAKECCKKWSVPYVDIFEEGQINTRIPAMANAFSYNNAGEHSGGNGTHLTQEGYDKFYVPNIKKLMLQLSNNYI